jgi:hypothetical protein
VLKEAAQGNAKPLVKFLATTFIVGEAYHNARDYLTGSESSMRAKLGAGQDDPQTLALSFLSNVAAGGAVGILADVLWSFSDILFGPIGGTVANVGRALVNTIQMPEQAGTAAKDFLDREFVVTRQARGLFSRMRAAAEEDHQRFFDYGTWRDRAFSYVGNEKNPTVADKAQQRVVDFLMSPSRVPTDRSLTYEQAGKAITGNDVEGAAEYIERLLRHAKDDEERASIERGLNTARRERSPMGPVPVRDRDAFLRQYPAAERTAARRLQREWERDWDRAVRLGERNARRRR